MDDKHNYYLKKCWICAEPLEQSGRGRPRLTCSERCRQARSRRLKGQMSWRHKREKKEIEGMRTRPFIERRFNIRTFQPIMELSYRRWAYECLACGEVHTVDRISSGAPISPYCSRRCGDYSKDHWKRFNAALELSHVKGKVDKRVLARMRYNKLSPLCPNCKMPFAPNTTLDGTRLTGRPRKWCSDACRKEAYEKRWKNTHSGRARGHRCRECAECGTWFDRTDSVGRRTKRFCKDRCASRFKARAHYAREKAKKMGKQGFKWGSSGHGAAAKSALKNRVTNGFRDTAQKLSSGKAGEPVYSGTTQALKGLIKGAKMPTRISTA